MRSGPVELQPAREFIQRMRALEAELQQARQQQRRQRANPDAALRWGLEPGPALQQEEGWFLTYLDMMTLLLVVMIVMLSFSGAALHSANNAPQAALSALPSTEPIQAAAPPGVRQVPVALAPPVSLRDAPLPSEAIPAPDYFAPYPAAPTADFYPLLDSANYLAALASAYPTPADLAPPPPTIPAPALQAASPSQPVPDQETRTAAEKPSASKNIESTPTQLAATAPAVADKSADEQSNVPSQTVQAPAAQAVVSAPSQPQPPVPNPQSEGQTLAADLALDTLGSEVEVVVNQRSVSLRINSEILFGTGQADLSPHGQDVLTRMAKLLVSKGYDIVVEGHTDSIPMRSNGRYPSNWELSTDRAGSVVRFLLANGIDKAHLRAVGFADTRPIGSNQDAQGRARNRRVELVIEKGQAPGPSAQPPADGAAPAAPPAAGQAALQPSETDLILQQAHSEPGSRDGNVNSPTE